VYSFLFAFCSNYGHIISRLWDKNGVTVKTGSEVMQDHSAWYHSKALVWFPIHLPYSIVTLALCCIISETKRDIGQKSWFLVKNHDFFLTPCIRRPHLYKSTYLPLGGCRRTFHPVWYGKTRMAGLPDGKKMWGYVQRCQQNTGMWQTRHLATA